MRDGGRGHPRGKIILIFEPENRLEFKKRSGKKFFLRLFDEIYLMGASILFAALSLPNYELHVGNFRAFGPRAEPGYDENFFKIFI